MFEGAYEPSHTHPTHAHVSGFWQLWAIISESLESDCMNEIHLIVIDGVLWVWKKIYCM